MAGQSSAACSTSQRARQVGQQVEHQGFRLKTSMFSGIRCKMHIDQHEDDGKTVEERGAPHNRFRRWTNRSACWPKAAVLSMFLIEEQAVAAGVTAAQSCACRPCTWRAVVSDPTAAVATAAVRYSPQACDQAQHFISTCPIKTCLMLLRLLPLLLPGVLNSRRSHAAVCLHCTGCESPAAAAVLTAAVAAARIPHRPLTTRWARRHASGSNSNSSNI